MCIDFKIKTINCLEHLKLLLSFFYAIKWIKCTFKQKLTSHALKKFIGLVTDVSF